MMNERKPKIGEVLVQGGHIKQSQLAHALDSQKSNPRKLGEVLVEMGFIQEAQLVEVLADIFRLPYVRLADVSIDDKALALVTVDFMQTHKILPISFDNGVLTVATHNPLDVGLLQELQFKCGHPVSPAIASLPDIKDHLATFINAHQKLNERVQDTRVKDQSSPMIKMVNSIFEQAIREKASDIHLQPQKDCLRVRYRIDGTLYDKTPVEKEMERQVLSRIKVMAGLDVAENRRPQDGRMTYTNNGITYDIRLSTIPDILGENLVMRILTKDYFNKDLASLGFLEDEVELIKKIIDRPHGLILTTGPTGAGKTTTLYSMLSRVNQPGRNIITVEDPVEYEMTGITQTAINDFIGYRFATAIRHILRHDPDIIMIGEIRDVETAEIAIRAALTGHLVLSTIHTNTAAGAITRLLEMKIEPFLISSALSAVFAQRLTRVLCPNCKEEYVPTHALRDSLKEYIPLEQSVTFARPTGCLKCLKTGFKGRTGIYEIIDVDDDMRALILKNADEHEMVAAAKKNGMKTLRASGIAKTVRKITDLEEIMRITAHE